MDKIFPRDMPVGTVVEVKPGTTFKQIRVRPAANLDRLEEVFVLLTQEPLEFQKAGGSAEHASAECAGARLPRTAPPAAEKP